MTHPVGDSEPTGNIQREAMRPRSFSIRPTEIGSLTPAESRLGICDSQEFHV
jgi:hypothetical protein